MKPFLVFILILFSSFISGANSEEKKKRNNEVEINGNFIRNILQFWKRESELLEQGLPNITVIYFCYIKIISSELNINIFQNAINNLSSGFNKTEKEKNSTDFYTWIKNEKNFSTLILALILLVIAITIFIFIFSWALCFFVCCWWRLSSKKVNEKESSKAVIPSVLVQQPESRKKDILKPRNTPANKVFPSSSLSQPLQYSSFSEEVSNPVEGSFQRINEDELRTRPVSSPPPAPPELSNASSITSRSKISQDEDIHGTVESDPPNTNSDRLGNIYENEDIVNQTKKGRRELLV